MTYSMKTTYPMFRLLVVAGLLCASFAAHATHYLAGNITYRRYLQTNQYEVQVILYTDAGPNAVDEPATELHCLPNLEAGCAAALQNDISMQLLRQRFELINPAQCGASNVKKNFYTGLVTLPPNRWTLLVDNVNRRAGIININNSVNTSGTISATLDNSTGLFNNSPEFVSTEILSLNGNQYHRFTAKAAEVDGDSVAYEFVAPQQGFKAQGCPQPAGGFYQPPHFRLDAVTGVLETVPFTLVQGDYVIAIQANEFRRLNGRWTKIGSVQRDMLYTVRAASATNTNPRFSVLQRGSATLDFMQAIPVNPGQTVDLTLTAADPDAGQQLAFSSFTPTIYSALYPFASFPAVQKLSATQGRLTWQVPASLPLGLYQFGLTVTDDFCPQSGREIRSIAFEVTNRVLTASTKAIGNVITAYPMPFHDQVQFQLPRSRSQQILITDEVGRTVAQLTSRADGTVVWQPAGSVKPGTYLARTTEGSYSVRLVHY
ncbi:hypothetical protein [Hymenobacter swuensis]|uniref:Secretion system C-terminal sorting domain-containing protein n=1 Tax=Hymenobacter swuensis DY53 TaxID=1227739 RepID=W8F0L1_9BACT|nr:hypothetical protein [Hymenobacter swuensis]AHJ98909.1 hypothetical protein Hsw_3314 [Hymenobacter swuensis DY53]